MVDVNTTVFNKQLEELENLADSGGLYDDQQEDDEEEVQAEPSIEWRRASLEEAYSRVKRAKGRPVDPSKVYEIGTLLFEPAEAKFGRVKRSVPGYLCIQFLRGGEREYGRRPDVENYLRDNHRGKTAAELAIQLGLTETEVQGHLNRLGLIRVDVMPGTDPHEVETKAPVKAAKSPREKSHGDDYSIPSADGMDHHGKGTKKDAKAPVRKAAPPPVEDDEDEVLARPLPPKGKEVKGSAKVEAKSSAPTKTPVAAASKTKVPAGKTATPAPAKAASSAKSTPPTKSTPPKLSKAQTPMRAGGMTPDEMNAYIKKHFKEMNNRELAAKTGLSEHTVRRKLGEWGLRRPRD